uniref:Uncharacterized protein n=1 Tax=Anguilla anguilla TaxID=7936 RepID=A0A0E9V842_ANGAN
MSVFSRWRQRQ